MKTKSWPKRKARSFHSGLLSSIRWRLVLNLYDLTLVVRSASLADSVRHNKSTTLRTLNKVHLSHLPVRSSRISASLRWMILRTNWHIYTSFVIPGNYIHTAFLCQAKTWKVFTIAHSNKDTTRCAEMQVEISEIPRGQCCHEYVFSLWWSSPYPRFCQTYTFRIKEWSGALPWSVRCWWRWKWNWLHWRVRSRFSYPP